MRGGVRLISSARMMFAKIGPGMNRILRLAGRDVFLDHVGAEDVGRHQIRRELDAAELEIDRVGERLDQERLGQTRHAAKQAVAARHQADDHLAHDAVLADDHAGQLALQVGDQRRRSIEVRAVGRGGVNHAKGR